MGVLFDIYKTPSDTNTEADINENSFSSALTLLTNDNAEGKIVFDRMLM
jgi:hypothetical protein